jgi:hypothetical protein
MRYIKIPAPFQLINPDNDTPLAAPHPDTGVLVPVEFSFSTYIRGLRQDERFLRGLDQVEAYDASASLIKASPGDVVPLQDATWAVLAECAKTPKQLMPIVIYSPGCRTFTEAVTLASTTKPE